MLIYLGLSALACFVVALLLAQSVLPASLAAVHLVFAAAVLPLIFGAITHFVPVLTRSGKAHRGVLLAPLVLQGAGLLAVLHFSGEAPVAVLHAAALSVLLVTLVFAGWLIVRARRTLGKPHPGWRWYLAAIVCLAIALALVPAMAWWPGARNELRLLHLHLNVLGFIGLTAIGTLQVLLPTALNGPDPEAAARLRQQLPHALGGVLAVAIGAALWQPLAVIGAAVFLLMAIRLAVSWGRRFGLKAIITDGAAAALAIALAGFIASLLFGIAHALRAVEGRDAVAAFIVLFLFPLVSGALSQLLPVWRCPGPRTPERQRIKAVLARGGGARALCLLLAGTALSLGNAAGYWLALGAMLSFLAAIAVSYRIRCRKRGDSSGR